MTAWTFLLRVPPSPKIVGAALVCPEARYCSIKWRDSGRPDRRFLPAAVWTAIFQELAGGISKIPLPWTSAIREQLKHPELTVTAEYLVAVPIDAQAGVDIDATLDAALKSQPLV